MLSVKEMASSVLMPLFFLALAISASVAIAGRPSAELSAPPPKPNVTEQFLEPHNRARAAVGVPPLSWSPRLAADASRYTRHQRDRSNCSFANLDTIPYGGSQLRASYPAAPADVVATFVSEKKYYDYSSNTCAAGQRCGTYTQVVWRRTAELGCAQSVCRKGDSITICFYYPHGNVQGQRPY